MTLMDRSEAHVGHADKVTSDILRCPTVTLMDSALEQKRQVDKKKTDINAYETNKKTLPKGHVRDSEMSDCDTHG